MASLGSPYARKVRIALEEKKIAYDFVLARPSEPNSRVSEFNPLGKVPVLIRDNGAPLYDSPVIVEYLDGLVPAQRLIPADFESRIEVKCWEALGDGIIDATVAISHDHRLGEPKRQPPEWHARQQRKIDGGLAAMEKGLAERDFCFGAAFSLADIACGVALGYLDRALPNFDWRKSHPRLLRHSERLAARESFQKTRPE
jgi:glutathione S-transferase